MLKSITTTRIVGHVLYTVSMPLGDSDMNFHFIPVGGRYDYLVDLGDVMEWYGLEAASIEDAIKYVSELGTVAFWSKVTL